MEKGGVKWRSLKCTQVVTRRQVMKTTSIFKSSLLIFLLAMVVLSYMQMDLLVAAFQTNPFQGSADSVARGETLWMQYCMACHGREGAGDGPATAQLSVKPKDLTMVALPPVFPDGILAYRIANGKKTMPAWKDVFPPDQVWDLVSYIRSKSKKTAKT